MTLAQTIAASLGQGKEQQSGDGYVTLCPVHGDSEPSLSVKDSTDNQGNPDIIVHCHAGCDWQDVKKELLDRGLVEKWTPPAKKTPIKKTKRKPAENKEETNSFVWSVSKKNDKLVSKYLANRSIKFTDDPVPACLKWNQYTDKKSQEKVSLVVCAATKPTDKSVKAVQRLFIDTDDYTKSGAKMLGDMQGRGIWFRRKDDKSTLIIGEGVETTLSAMQAKGINGVACLSTAGMKSIILPEETKTIYILVDSDKARDPKNKKSKGWPGQRAAFDLAERFEKEKDGNRAWLVEPTDSCFSSNPLKLDFNDLLHQDESGQSIRDRFELATEYMDLEWRPPGPEESKPDQENTETDITTSDGFYPEATLERLQAMNATYSAVLLGGKFRIIKETMDYSANRNMIDFLEISSFYHYLANNKVPVIVGDEKVKMLPISQVWEKWEGRKTYDNVAFSPGNNLPKSVYNLFRGFPVEPVAGDWSLLKGHILDNLCDGDNHIYDYVLAWMARIIQDPGGKKPGVAIVLKGGKGVGKGIFANAFGRLFGDAFLPIATPKGFTGQFNMHLSKCLFVFLDEAVWGGDKEVEGQLKALITEPTMLFQPKGIDSIAMENHMNILMASNNDWVIPASIDERRFLVLKVNNKKQQDSKYFGAIDHQMESGGYEAMMRELLEHDYSQVDLRKAPHTEGLVEQVDETLDPTLSFWKSVISRGFLLSYKDTGAPRKTDFRKGSDDEWPDIVWKYEIFHEFKEVFCAGKRVFTSETKFWKDTRKFWPGGVTKEGRVLANGGTRKRNVFIPTLPEMKTCFSDLTGIKINDDIEEVREEIDAFSGQF